MSLTFCQSLNRFNMLQTLSGNNIVRRLVFVLVDSCIRVPLFVVTTVFSTCSFLASRSMFFHSRPKISDIRMPVPRASTMIAHALRERCKAQLIRCLACSCVSTMISGAVTFIGLVYVAGFLGRMSSHNAPISNLLVALTDLGASPCLLLPPDCNNTVRCFCSIPVVSFSRRQFATGYG